MTNALADVIADPHRMEQGDLSGTTLLLIAFTQSYDQRFRDGMPAARPADHQGVVIMYITDCFFE